MSNQKIKVRAPAKINLYLKVLNKRPDGYHNIQSIFQALCLYDELEFELKTEGIQLSCQGMDIPASDNLVQQAALLLQERFTPPGGVSVC